MGPNAVAKRTGKLIPEAPAIVATIEHAAEKLSERKNTQATTTATKVIKPPSNRPAKDGRALGKYCAFVASHA